MDWGWLIAILYYLFIYLGYLVAPAVPVIQSILLQLKRPYSVLLSVGYNKRIRSGRSRDFRIQDLARIRWMLLCLCILVFWGSVLWTEQPASGEYFYFADTYDQVIISVWYEILLLATTCMFAWWWFQLKSYYVNYAFVWAMGGWAITRAGLSIYRFIAATDFNSMSWESMAGSTLTFVVALVILIVLVCHFKKLIIASNALIFALALLIVVPQILRTLSLDAIYIIIIPSIAIAHWLAASRPVIITPTGRRKILTSLVLMGSVTVVMLIFGVIPLIIVAPNLRAGVDVDEIVILNLAAWTAPFIGSAVVYIGIKRISIDPISREWASLAWLILNFMAAFWSSIIDTELSEPANSGDAILEIGLVYSIGIGTLAVAILMGSLLLGRGAAIRPLFAASIWLAVWHAMTPLLTYSEIPQVLKMLYSFELALTLTMVFVITSWVFGVGSPRKATASDS